MDLTFAPVDRPEVSRASEPNPFDTVVAELAKAHKAGDTKAARSFTLPHKTAEEKTAAASLLRKLGKAGGPHDVSVRKSVKDDKGVLSVTFWVRDKIAHKDAKGTPEAPQIAPTP